MPADKKLHNSSIKIPGFLKVIAKTLEFISAKLAVTFMIKLFTTPIKFKTPKREEEMDRSSRQEIVLIPALSKSINVYHLGESPKKVLLVHGWGGRGTQLHTIAAKLVKNGYATLSFDAPAHGKSTGKTSDMTEFITCILHLEKQFGPFEYAVGHSLGAMAVLNAVKRGLKIHKAVLIGSGDVIKDIMDDFSKKLGMKIASSAMMINRFEKKFGESINNYSAYMAAKDVTIPVLIFHDEDDADVPVSAAYHIKQNLANAQLVITHKLGHRKILGDKTVIKQIIEFFEA